MAMIHFFSPTKMHFFPTIDFLPIFLNEDGRIRGKRLVSCIVDFDDIQLWLRQFFLNLNICKGMTVLLIFLGQNFKKIVVTCSLKLQILRFKQNCLRQSWISSKSIMQLTTTFFPNSAIFIEKKWVENRLLGKSGFLWEKNVSCRPISVPCRKIPTKLRENPVLIHYSHYSQLFSLFSKE